MIRCLAKETPPCGNKGSVMNFFLSSDLVSFKQLKMFSRQMFVIPTFGSSVNVIFVLFQLHRNRGVKAGYQILSWGESQTQVFHALNTVISYLPRSNVLRHPTPNAFSLLFSDSYGYDIKCWFHTKMIINIRNKLFSSCLGSLHKKLNW